MRAVVVGAGIAGLASALSLARARHEVVLVERRTGFGETGAGIQLSPNATRLLSGLGLGAALARTACEPERVRIRSLASGRDIGAVALGDTARRLFGAPFLTVARADLHTVLLDAVRAHPGLRIRVGRTVAAVRDRGDGIDVTLRSEGGGEERLAADLVVGADGLWSTVRGLVGDRRRPHPTGYAAYRATVPVEALPDGAGGREVGLWLGRARHLVHYPVAGGRALNVVAIAPGSDAVEGWSGDADAARVVRLFDGRHEDALRPLRAATAWAAWSLYDLPSRELARGRVALVGDAAHPVLPYLAQGGSLAIEDAAHLATSLGAVPGDVPAALRRYAGERSDRVRRVGREARRNGAVYHAGFPVSAGRDLVIRRLGPEGMLERYRWLYGWTVPGAA